MIHWGQAMCQSPGDRGYLREWSHLTAATNFSRDRVSSLSLKLRTKHLCIHPPAGPLAASLTGVGIVLMRLLRDFTARPGPSRRDRLDPPVGHGRTLRDGEDN